MKQPEKFIHGLDEQRQRALLEAASNNITPDPEALQAVYDIVLEALTELEVPQFADTETAAYIFQALFDAELMKEWLEWLGSQLRIKTNDDMSLTELTHEEVRKLYGGAIKGQNEVRLLSRLSDRTKKLIVFGPYTEPVEILPGEKPRFRTPEFDPSGYFVFPGGNPGTVEQAVKILYEYGFSGCTQSYVAGAIVDGPEYVAAKMPQVETVIQVSFNSIIAYAVRVFPITNKRNTEDFVKKTFVGCERQNDVLMIRMKED